MNRYTLGQLCDKITSHVHSHLTHFQSSSRETNAGISAFIDLHMLTNSGNNRYPAYYGSVLRHCATQIKQMLENQNLIYCYEIENNLYTTYDASKSNNYNFKGTTKILNYRQDPKIDKLVLNSQYTDSGLYYPCGKKYY